MSSTDHPIQPLPAHRGSAGYTGGVTGVTDTAASGPGSYSGAQAGGTATHLASIGATTSTTALSAIAGSYADLAAARTSVNALRGEVETARGVVETRLDAVEAKIDALLAALQAAHLMA